MLAAFLAAGAGTAQAQNVTVTGSTGADASYATVGAAFTAINGNSQGGNNIVVSITGNTTETAGATLNESASPWTSLTISPSGGAARTITGNLANVALIDLSGADNVTINGFEYRRQFTYHQQYLDCQLIRHQHH